jgi:hypothetical protein
VLEDSPDLVPQPGWVRGTGLPRGLLRKEMKKRVIGGGNRSAQRDILWSYRPGP